jgi:hypothetical protein
LLPLTFYESIKFDHASFYAFARPLSWLFGIPASDRLSGFCALDWDQKNRRNKHREFVP